MKCKNCGKEVTETNKMCPSCGTILCDDKTTISNDKTAAESKTILLGIVGILLLIGCIGLGIYYMSEEETSKGIVYILSGIISFVFIKGFSDMIDLLDSINKKIR